MAFVQANSGFSGGPVALTGVTAGNCLAAWICGQSSMASTALPAGWVKQTVVVNGTAQFGCWWVYPDHPGGTVSAAITSAPSTCAWSVHEYSGRHLTAPVEDHVTNTGTSTTWSCPNVDVSEGADLVAAAAQPFTVFTITETVVGMTSRSAITNQVHASFSKDGMTAGAYSPGGAVSSASNPWVAASFGLLSADAPTTPTVVASASSALSTANPSLTFTGYVPLENDVVVMFPSSTTVLGIVADASMPAGWINPLGDGIEVNSDAHGIACAYHIVTAAEETAVTTTYTATGLLDAAETGNTVGCVIRNVDPAAVINAQETAFNSANTVTPHVLAGLTSAGGSQPTVDDALVISCVAKDGTGAYASDPAGWSAIVTSNTNQGKWLGRRTALTVAAVDIAAVNITPSAGDEYCSITLAFAPGGISPGLGAVTGGVDFAGSATGARASRGAATGTVTAAGSATGEHVSSGAVSGGVAFAGSATGNVPANSGDVTGGVDFAGSASGGRASRGSTSATVTFAGSATGARIPKGSTVGSVDFAGSAVGDTPPNEGSVTATVAFAGSAAGTAPAVGVNDGAATGSVTFAGSVTGERSSTGATTGTVAAAGTATGERQPKGSVVGTVDLAGTATGVTPAVGVNDGAAVGTVAFAGSAVGRHQPKGAVTAVLTVDGTATGRRTSTGATTGTVDFAGSAVGLRPGAALADTAPFTVGLTSDDATATLVGTATRRP